MRSIVRGLCCAGLVVGLSPFASAATTAITGIISDDCDTATRAKLMAMHETGYRIAISRWRA
jgi:hypothetical protein